MKITIDELQQLSLLLIKKLKNSVGSEIILDDKDYDYYLMVSRPERSNIEIDNPKLAIGSLIDDMQGLRNVLSGKYEPCSLDLERLGQLLIALGQYMEKGPYIF